MLRLLSLELGLENNVLEGSAESHIVREWVDKLTSTVYEPFSAILVMVPMALGGSMIL